MYCTKADLIARGWESDLLATTDISGLGVIDDAIVDKAIADAAGEIDAYLSARYVTPIINPSENIVKIACDLARYFLFDKIVPEHIGNRMKVIYKYLEMAAKGDVIIVVTDSSAGDTPSLSPIISSDTATDWSVF